MIVNTSKILLTQVKMMLDRSLIENGKFTTQLESGHLLQTVGEITEILQGQASIRNIEIKFEPRC
jgi:signal transduction histidine kinase